MKLCPKCNSELDLFKNKYVCSNDDCDYTLKNSQNTKRDSITGLLDESLWLTDVFDEYPAIIAHEYWRLYTLIKEEQLYGALLQLKDLFEVFIKFPTLILVSEIYHKQTRNEEENRILITVLQKPLSLGDWEDIGRSLEKQPFSITGVQEILSDIVEIYKNLKFTNWRNKIIGHGALGYDYSPAFLEDLKEKIQAIRDHLLQNASIYKKSHLYLLEQDKRILLRGKDQARNITLKGELYFEVEGRSVLLNPFILVENNGLFFFDSYFSRRQKTDILNYPDGEKYIHKGKELQNLFGALVKEHQLSSLTNSVEQETYSALEEEIFTKIQLIDDYQRPDYLNTWIEQQMRKFPQGIFLLQMERGTGKTTFSRGLDPHALNKVHFENTSIRNYYINDTYLYNVDNFVSEINVLFMKNNQGSLFFKGKLPSIRVDSDEKKGISLIY